MERNCNQRLLWDIRPQRQAPEFWSHRYVSLSFCCTIKEGRPQVSLWVKQNPAVNGDPLCEKHQCAAQEDLRAATAWGSCSSLSPVNILETGPRSSGVASAFLHWTVLLAFIPPSDDLLNAESHGYIDFLTFSGLTLPLWAFYVLQMSMWISGLFFCLGKFLELPLPSKTCSFSWSNFSALTIGFC